MKNKVRIIGGEFRGKHLSFPSIEGLRPTPDRVRETLFNWLMFDVRGASCLDAFAGSGALGFEALSRGAAHVTFLEKDPIAYQNLLKQAVSFPTHKRSILNVDTCEYLKQSHTPFSLIFLDPPFTQNYLPDCLESLTKNKLLTKDGVLYIESQQSIETTSSLWRCLKIKKAGQITFGIYTQDT